MKKFSLLLSVLAMLFGTLGCGGAAAKETVPQDPYSSNIERSVELAARVKSANIDTSVKNSSGAAVYKSDYGGCYIDDSGILNVCGTSEEGETPEGTVYKRVARPYNRLKAAYEFLQLNMETVGITELNVSQKNNVVNVSVESEVARQNVLALLRSNGFDTAAAQITVKDPSIELTAGYAHAGQKCSFSYGFLWLWTWEGSICGQAVENATGKRGVVTCWHCIDVKDTTNKIKHANGDMGRPVKGGYFNKIDAAFVRFDDQNYWKPTASAKSKNVTYNNVRYGGAEWTVEGMRIFKLGMKTDYTEGVIISDSGSFSSTNSYNRDKFSLYDCIVTNASAAAGDSGGPVYAMGGPKGSVYLIGMNEAYDSYARNLWAIKTDNICEALDITFITNDNKADFGI